MKENGEAYAWPMRTWSINLDSLSCVSPSMSTPNEFPIILCTTQRKMLDFRFDLSTALCVHISEPVGSSEVGTVLTLGMNTASCFTLFVLCGGMRPS